MGNMKRGRCDGGGETVTAAAPAAGAHESLAAVVDSHESVTGAAHESEAIEAMLVWLTRSGATGLESVSVRVTPHGHGVFCASANGIEGGAQIASVPAACAVSVAGASRSEIGLACAALVDGPSAEMVLWLEMIAGRADAQHPQHPYLRALPAELPDAPSWPAHELALLDGTNVGAAARSAAESLRVEFKRLDAAVRLACPALAPALSLDALRWARSMYFSRRFPSRLVCCDDAANACDDTASQSVLLPFFDLLNHDPHTSIEWLATSDGVRFVAGPEGVAAGGEVFNSYGSKSNEELVMAHGFALWDNPFDVYGLSLAVLHPARDGLPARRAQLGPFHIRREDASSEDRPQFPNELWRALADPQGDRTAPRDDDAPVEVDLDDVELLLATLDQRLAPFAATAARDQQTGESDASSRKVVAARYRDGQRRVLEDGVRVLNSWLATD